MSPRGRGLAPRPRPIGAGAPTPAARVSVSVRASDPRVEQSLRHLLSASGDLTVRDDATAAPRPADVDVVELPHGGDLAVAGVLGERSGSTPLVVIGADSTTRSAADAVPSAVYLDRGEVADRLHETVLALAAPRTRPSPADPSWFSIFVVMAAVFVGPWTVWFSRIAEDRGLTSWHLPQGVALWTIPPVLVAAVAATSGRAGLLDLGARLVRVRVPGWTPLVAVATPVAIAACAAAIVGLAGGPVPVGVLMSLPAAAAYLVYGTGLFLLTEEAAWRGTLLPRLSRRTGAARASVLVGLAWGAWHLPLLAVRGAADHGLPPVLFVLLVVGTSVLISALVVVARGSVVVAALFHASFDASYSWFGVVGVDHAMLWVATLVTLAVAGALLCCEPLRRRWAPVLPAAAATWGRACRHHRAAASFTAPLNLR